MAATIERIAALLVKAERTDNEAEAEAYLMKAQQLATMASIDLAVARSGASRREARQQPEARTTTIGERGKRANRHLIGLYIVVAQANDAQVDIAANSTYVIGYGMPSDLDVIDAMFASLSVHMVQAGQQFVVGRDWEGETYIAVENRRRRVKPHTAQTARVAFYRAYTTRIQERLGQARASALREAPEQASGSTSVAVALREKAAEVASFHRTTSDARGSWGGYRGSVRSSSGSAAQAGRWAASRARLGDAPGIAGAREIGQ